MPVELSGLFEGLDGLIDIKESLARRMGVAAGAVVRDAAKELAPEGSPEDGYGADWRHPSNIKPGALRDAIYLAYAANRSDRERFTYAVSWNAKQAYWGAMVEFGVDMVHQVATDGEGNFWTVKDENGLPTKRSNGPMMARKAGPLRIEARPFLGPALDANHGKMLAAALQAGKVALNDLLVKGS